MLEWALYWAAQGVPVFPVHSAVDGLCSCSRGSECTDVGKHPRTPKGLKDATTDAEQIKQWWRKWPEANIGGVTGGRLRILVVDCDPKNGGDASLFDLTEAHGGEWLNTLHVETGSLGSHLFFTYPADVELRNSAGKVAPGIDTRAEGGYVVLPPSLHVSGRRYRIAAAKPMQPAPVWLIEGLTRTPDQKPSNVTNFQERRTRRNSDGAIIPEGERNVRLFRVGCAIWGSGNVQDLTDLHARLLEVNAERCSPPMHDLDIAKIAGSIAARYSRGGLIKEGATA
jgi:putative DNA primase/helicase